MGQYLRRPLIPPPVALLIRLPDRGALPLSVTILLWATGTAAGPGLALAVVLETESNIPRTSQAAKVIDSKGTNVQHLQQLRLSFFPFGAWV